MLETTQRLKTAFECEVKIKEKLSQMNGDQENNINIFHNVLGLAMKKVRLNRCITQTKVACWLKITFQQVQKYENGVNKIPFHNLYIFAEKSKCGIDYFLNYFNGLNLTTNANGNANGNANAKEKIEYEQPNA